MKLTFDYMCLDKVKSADPLIKGKECKQLSADIKARCLRAILKLVCVWEGGGGGHSKHLVLFLILVSFRLILFICTINLFCTLKV